MYASILIIAEPSAAHDISQFVQPGCSVHHIQLGDDCINAVLRLRPEIILLDARRRNQSFAEVCRCLTSVDDIGAVPLVALVRAGTTDHLDLLEAGADDCWVDPIDGRNFRVRLNALNRRLNRCTKRRVLRRGAVELDLYRFTVRASGPPAQLTAMQLKVLKHLMENAGVFISHNDLLDDVWCDAELSQDAVRTCMKRLRQILSATGAVDVIRSVKGGYLFDTGIPPMRVPWGTNKDVQADSSK